MAVFDWKKPTVQMLGRWQPWHAGHTQLFRKIHSMTGQVAIMVRDVPSNTEANQRVPGQDDNPFNIDQVKDGIKKGLLDAGFTFYEDYVIIEVPNIVDISYGRGVGYTFTEHDLGAEIHDISATKIRAQMRKEGTLANKH